MYFDQSRPVINNYSQSSCDKIEKVFFSVHRKDWFIRRPPPFYRLNSFSMSAVDDVEARIYRLQTALQGKLTELQTMLIHQQYNASMGVDQDSQGRSVASLEVKVLGARRVLFRSGFLCGAWVLFLHWD